MNAIQTPLLTITPEAAARVTELGMQAELEQMLERARQTIPQIERLAVINEPAHDTGDEPYLTIEVFVPCSPRWDDRSEQEWGRWKARTFPPEIGRHIALLIETSKSADLALPPSLTAPVHFAPEARQRLDELGMAEELVQMLEQACRTVKGLQQIKVEVNDRRDGSNPGLLVSLIGNDPSARETDLYRPLGEWMLRTFPPEVREHILIDLAPGDADAG